MANIWQFWGRVPRWGLALFVAGIVLTLGGLAGQVADYDGDGLSTWKEGRLGTDATSPDSDGDGAIDGLEVQIGTNPLARDSDADGLLDGEEIQLKSNPLNQDTDQDGILDGMELDQDCDGDGIPAVASSDDDSDLRPDALEDPRSRCNADADDDTLLDGEEANPACVFLVDCDGDGISDADERGGPTSPLDPDTFKSGLPDPVALAFAERGQPATPDQDGDGIPDGWESATGALDWGPFDPEPARADLLIEYLRVEGPQSGRFGLNFTPAYDAVADLFASGGIHVQWIETVIAHPTESRPDFLTAADVDHFRGILENGTGSTNPYVTSIILNPQQVQSHPGSVLGAAFLRNMVATLDYGAHTDFNFRTESGTNLDPVRPIVESHIAAGDQDLVTLLYGYDSSGYLPSGEAFMREEHHPSIGQGFQIHWQPNWFSTPPTYTADDGQSTTLALQSVVLQTGELASTIAHELGHTLSLCHTHEIECYSKYGVGPSTAGLSTMSYNAPIDQLAFLTGEWEAMYRQLTCPPQTTAALIAKGAGDDAVLAAKYDAAFYQEVQQRECQDFTALPALYEPTAERTLYTADVDLREGRDGRGVQQAYFGAVALLSVGAAAGAWFSRR